MKTRKILAILIFGCLTACSTVTPTATTTNTPLAQATATKSVTNTPLPATPLPSATLPSATDTAVPFVGSGRCLHAKFESETIPDNTLINPGESFRKTWALKNIGECTWTEEFSLVFHHGEQFGAVERIPLAGWVRPGEAVLLNVDLVAPTSQGKHIGFWSLEADDGTPFGIGAQGVTVFWVQVLVPGPDPLPVTVNLNFASRGTIRSNLTLSGSSRAGDSGNDLSWQSFATFGLKDVPSDATITAVSFGFSESYEKSTPDPFESLGCLGVYLDNYGEVDISDYTVPGLETPLWSFCSLAQFKKNLAGDEVALNAFINALADRQIQFRFQFDAETDSDGIEEYIEFFPQISVTFTFAKEE